MSNPVANYFRSLRPGPRLILLVYTLGFPLGFLGHYSRLYDLQEWLGLSPALVWKGQIWRAVTYGFFPSCIAEWVSTVFWLATLLPVIGGNWTTLGFIGYCALSAFGGSLPFLLWHPSWDIRLTISVALVFGLLVAWNRFHRNERLVLLGMGEASVRQVVKVTAAVISVILFLTAGPIFVLLAWSGGFAGWLWILAGEWRLHAKPARQVHSGRGARLEL